MSFTEIHPYDQIVNKKIFIGILVEIYAEKRSGIFLDTLRSKTRAIRMS